MKSLKILCALVCFLLLAAQLWSMSHWNEARGVYDDVCYLRQAHLFQRFGRAPGVRRVALVTLANLVVNLAFFLSHPVFTPYYTIPIAMLSLWSLSFAALTGPAEVVYEGLVGRAANARS